MRKIVVFKEYANLLAATDAELASHIKAMGMGRQVAWGQFVKFRDLRPRINAKEFYALYDRVPAISLDIVHEKEVEMTHFDTLLQACVHIHLDEESGVYKMIWEHGMTGGSPPIHPPDPARYIPLSDYHG